MGEMSNEQMGEANSEASSILDAVELARDSIDEKDVETAYSYLEQAQENLRQLMQRLEDMI